MGKVRIAVQGCCHGELNKVLEQVCKIHEENPLDLLLILGDFQSIRDETDLQSLSVPPKYQRMGDFHEYYMNDEFKLPCMTVFIGGNHESMRHLMLLPHGGYVAPNLFYMGYSNVLWYRGVRIGGLSGIWKRWDYEKVRPTWEELEKTESWAKRKKELYHVRRTEVEPLEKIQQPVDIFMSHDWPNGVAYHGDLRALLNKKPFFEKDIQQRQLGSPVSWQLLRQLKPRWWLSAHLHVRYEAVVKHGKRKVTNENELELDLSDEEKEEEPSETRFLALDKCLPRRRWLEVIEVDADESHESWKHSGSLYWDREFISNLQGIPASDYQIPAYSTGIQRQEELQTSQFVQRFFNDCLKNS